MKYASLAAPLMCALAPAATGPTARDFATGWQIGHLALRLQPLRYVLERPLKKLIESSCARASLR